MDNNERQLLAQFLDQLVQARGIAKDPDADAMIRNANAQQPDAAYLLVQKALLQDQALKNAKVQIDQLQAEINNLRSQLSSSSTQAASAGTPSFFGGASFMGGGNSAPRPTVPAPAPAYAAPAPGYPPMAPQAAAPASSPWGGFLASAATTAAGVAGGAFLFEGISSLMGGHHSSGDHGGGFLSSNNGYDNLPQQNVENVTVNNYYEGSASDNAPQDTNLAYNTDNDDDVLNDDSLDA